MEKHRTIIKPPSAIRLNLGELWQYRELIYFFTWRDLKVKYKQTALGILWAVLQPLGFMLLFTLIFSRTGLARITEGLPYEVFVLSGLILWTLFHTSVSHAADGMIVNANIIKKIYFPRLVVPIAAIMAALVDFLVSLLLFFLFCMVYEQALSPSAFLYFPAAIFLCLLSAFGLGSWLGALNVKYRDFRYALPFLLQLLFFGSQIIYSLDMIEEEWLRLVLALNPFNAVLELFRGGITGSIDSSVVLMGMATSLLLALGGLIYFKKTEAYFADIA